MPNTVGDIEPAADLKARRITACISVNAPEDRGGRARCSWIVRQLKDAPPGLIIETYAKNARTPVSATLAVAGDIRGVRVDRPRGSGSAKPVDVEVAASE